MAENSNGTSQTIPPMPPPPPPPPPSMTPQHNYTSGWNNNNTNWSNYQGCNGQCQAYQTPQGSWGQNNNYLPYGTFNTYPSQCPLPYTTPDHPYANTQGMVQPSTTVEQSQPQFTPGNDKPLSEGMAELDVLLKTPKPVSNEV